MPASARAAAVWLMTSLSSANVRRPSLVTSASSLARCTALSRMMSPTSIAMDSCLSVEAEYASRVEAQPALEDLILQRKGLDLLDQIRRRHTKERPRRREENLVGEHPVAVVQQRAPTRLRNREVLRSVGG